MSDNRTRIWFALFVLAIFCVGMASGIIIGRRLGPPPREPGMARRGPVGPGPGAGLGRGAGPGGGPPPGRLIERLDEELQLTPEQKTKVGQVLDSRRERLESVQNEVIARAEQEQKELQAEIRKVLTPDQQQRFDRWLADTPRGRRGGRGPMGGGPLGPPPR